LVRLSADRSADDLVLASDGQIYFAVFCRRPEENVTIIRLRLSKDIAPPSSVPSLVDAQTEKFNGNIISKLRTDDRNSQQPNAGKIANFSPVAAELQHYRTSSQRSHISDTQQNEHNRGYQDALHIVQYLPWSDLEKLAKHNFNFSTWLNDTRCDWVKSEISAPQPGAKIARLLPLLASHLGELVDQSGPGRRSFRPSNEYVAGYVQAFRETWSRHQSQHVASRFQSGEFRSISQVYAPPEHDSSSKHKPLLDKYSKTEQKVVVNAYLRKFFRALIIIILCVVLLFLITGFIVWLVEIIQGYYSGGIVAVVVIMEAIFLYGIFYCSVRLIRLLRR